MVLRKNGAVVDAFGQIGVDPGSQWPGGGQDDTLRRADTVCAGDTNPDDAFDASVEWVTFAQNTFDGLGSHTATCGGGSTGLMVIINEVDSDTPSNDVLEFIELYDGGVGNTALDGLVVVLYNGSNDASYDAFDLDGFATDANGYFVIGTVPENDLFVDPGSFGWLQNGADAVALYTGDAADFPNDTPVNTTNLIDAIVYDTNDGDDAGLLALVNAGQPQVNEGGAGDKDNHSNQRCPNGSGGALNTSSYEQWAATPGAENICEVVVLPLSCDDDSVITMIHEVQGSGAASTLVGNVVVIDGVVVGDFQNNATADDGDLNGFYVQEEDADVDGNVLTSEGVFVFGTTDVDVSTGDHVRVRGTVSEYVTSSGASSLTEVNVSEVAQCAAPAPMPAATNVTLPVSAIADFEQYEGMLVSFPQSLVISEYFNFDRFNEVVLAKPVAGQNLPFQPTAVFEPGSVEAADLADLNARSRITLDDGRSSQNSDPALHPNGNVFDLTNLFRGGDLIEAATGVIDDTFGIYRLQPTEAPIYTAVNARTPDHDPVGGRLEIASFNVLNYFNTIDDGDNDICGADQIQECRGADDEDERVRQLAKIVAAMADIEADVFGVIEVENTPGVEAMADIVGGLNGIFGAGTYAYVDTGVIGTDAIKVGFIYDTTTVSPSGAFAVLDDPAFVNPFGATTDRNRPALAQTFMENANGAEVTVVVNHLKSKGSPCGVGDDDPEQGSCNLTRTVAAQVLVDWLATDPTNSGDADILVIGDLNSYDKEDPIDVLTGAGYTDLAAFFNGEFAYSYVFSGQFGYLDYALANSSLLSQVTGATEWHINADEPDILDYDTSFKQDAQDALYEPNAYRSSDHDPIIVGLDLNAPPVCETAVPSIDKLWPPNHQFVAIDVLGVTDPDGDPITIVIDSIFQDEAVNAPGSGNTAPDGRGLGTQTAEVRSERVGNGNGRVYHITFTASDNQGNSCTGKVLVSVPLNNKGEAVDDGPLFDSTVLPNSSGLILNESEIILSREKNKK